MNLVTADDKKYFLGLAGLVCAYFPSIFVYALVGGVISTVSDAYIFPWVIVTSVGLIGYFILRAINFKSPLQVSLIVSAAGLLWFLALVVMKQGITGLDIIAMPFALGLLIVSFLHKSNTPNFRIFAVSLCALTVVFYLVLDIGMAGCNVESSFASSECKTEVGLSNPTATIFALTALTTLMLGVVRRSSRSR